jgi:hypothetical protein
MIGFPFFFFIYFGRIQELIYFIFIYFISRRDGNWDLDSFFWCFQC